MIRQPLALVEASWPVGIQYGPDGSTQKAGPGTDRLVRFVRRHTHWRHQQTAKVSTMPSGESVHESMPLDRVQ